MIKAARIAKIALMAAIIALCAMVTIPAAIPFTLQTFGVFFALLVLGGRDGMWAVGVYLLLGGVGLPVFSAFQGGIGVLLGPTGGFLLGLAALAGIYKAVTFRFGEGKKSRLCGLILGLLGCYIMGTLWYALVYSRGSVGIAAAISSCVLPFVIPDGVKMYLAWRLGKRMKGK